jgi:pyrimidine deaminase RibD-like protein
MPQDKVFMQRALELAREGWGLVSPNPLVGAVVVRDGQVLGEGYYRYDGVRHAESYAIEKAGQLARGATLYCNLEPCSHYGRTPPCTDAIVEAGIARAVIAIVDPDLRVNGRGVERLRAAGIEVEVGLCETEASHLNESYLKYAERGTPFLHAVLSTDGETGEWVPSKELMYDLFSCDAIIVVNSGESTNKIATAMANRKRHRPMVVAASDEAIVSTRLIGEGGRRNEIVRVDFGGENGSSITRADLESGLRTMASLRVTSVAIFDAKPEIDDHAFWAQVDKLTVISSRNPPSGAIPARFQNICVRPSSTLFEITGYPARG